MNTLVANSLDLKMFLQVTKDFVDGYDIDKNNENEIKCLNAYFMQDEKFHSYNDFFDLGKGLMLLGPVGTGKTLLMRIWQRFMLYKDKKTFSILHINALANNYIEQGASSLEKYNQKDLLVDDIGLFDKEDVKRWGNQTNVFEEIVMYRYEKFIDNGIKTHFTTNLTVEQIEKEYNPRIWSRLKEMCNMIPLVGLDRRDYAKPRKKVIEVPKTISQEEQDKESFKTVIDHWKKCREIGEYIDFGFMNILANVYYDFLDRKKILQYSDSDKRAAMINANSILLKEAENEFKNLVKKTIEPPSENAKINRAKSLLFQDFIMNNDVEKILNPYTL